MRELTDDGIVEQRSMEERGYSGLADIWIPRRMRGHNFPKGNHDHDLGFVNYIPWPPEGLPKHWRVRR